MSEATVFEKVEQLRSETRRLATAEKGADEARRIGSRVTKLKASLGELRTQVELACKVNETIGSNRVDLSAVDDGYRDFEAKVRSVTNPNNAVFERANQRIAAVCKRLEEETRSAWSTWASARISELHLTRIPMLPPRDQREARRKQGELERWSRGNELSRPIISLFTTSISGLADMLADAPDAPPEVADLMVRLSGDQPPTLAQITDDEISLLRSLHFDEQITLKRIST
ncbi:hypothetical protein G7043_15770 [Lentzea sp. NEAU-D13]|uniref:Uncharacterized protein n=1 Tax=Lentzea alba TaxID=2714351 RepID=A0A7C9RQY6_9PSEU|nr:hypothetical protein [Lentzea alba]NGY60387.1 hypothetical protein [Lentzea alba]